MKYMRSAFAGLAILAAPASAVEPLCRGDACAVVSLVFTRGCWAYHNLGNQWVSGAIATITEAIRFEIAPNAFATPRFKNGACLSSARAYHVDFEPGPMRKPARRN
jgi:hypothetical protein